MLNKHIDEVRKAKGPAPRSQDRRRPSRPKPRKSETQAGREPKKENQTDERRRNNPAEIGRIGRVDFVSRITV